MSKTTDFDEQLLNMEEALYLLDKDLETLSIDRIHMSSMFDIITFNLSFLRKPGVVVSLEMYKRSVEEQKFLRQRVRECGAKIELIKKKMVELEKSVKFRQDMISAQQTQQSNILFFKRKQYGC